MLRSIVMSDGDWRALDDLARRTNTRATRGVNSGQPSRLALLRRLLRDDTAQQLLIDHWDAQSSQPRHDLPQSVLLRPPNPVTKTIAWISTAGNRVRIFQPEKRDDFGALIKGMGFAWADPYWERDVPAASLLHRVAETCYRLVAAGFCTVPPNTAVAQRVIDGDYEHEDKRRVMVRSNGEYRGWFVIWWSREEDLYDAAKKITASRYDKPNVIVPPEHYAEVLDFAARYHFALSPAAQERARQAESMMMSALLLDLPAEERMLVDDSIPELQPIEGAIDNELADDPL